MKTIVGVAERYACGGKLFSNRAGDRLQVFETNFALGVRRLIGHDEQLKAGRTQRTQRFDDIWTQLHVDNSVRRLVSGRGWSSIPGSVSTPSRSRNTAERLM